MARNSEVAQAFAKAESGKAGNLQTDGFIVFSYAEPIAIHMGSDIHITMQKWSQTTSRHTNAVRGAVRAAGYEQTGHDGLWEVWT